MARDDACVKFMQWALPMLRMQWPGFRRVRSQVCKRLQRRMQVLQLTDFSDYQDYCEQHADEWQRLDQYCRVTVTRFYRDKMVFAYLADQLLPQLAHALTEQGRTKLNCWSVGCASGEEPYSLALLWHFVMQADFPDLQINILASDVNQALIERAQLASYSYATVKNLPESWRQQAFSQKNDLYHLLPQYREPVTFISHDVRQQMPSGPFDLILCRNLVFTYYDFELQQDLLQQFHEALVPNGFLLLGVHEVLPSQSEKQFQSCSQRFGVYQKITAL